jgi:hypothetical protein
MDIKLPFPYPLVAPNDADLAPVDEALFVPVNAEALVGARANVAMIAIVARASIDVRANMSDLLVRLSCSQHIHGSEDPHRAFKDQSSAIPPFEHSVMTITRHSVANRRRGHSDKPMWAVVSMRSIKLAKLLI